MDRALLKEREAFKRRALATPTVENKVRKVDSHGGSSKSSSSSASKSKGPDINFKSMLSGSNSSQYKFSVLARIVRHMRSRHQEGETHALALPEILDETNQLNVGPKIKQWLVNEALPSNPKVREAEEGSGTWVFNPPLPVRDKKSLLKLVRLNDIKGHGGIALDDIQESVPHYARVMKAIEKDILVVTRQTDKKQIIFYHDHSLDFPVDPEFQQLWRNSSVDGMHDDNIAEYLSKQGIKSMQDVGRVFRPARRKTKSRRNLPTKITDNDHLAHVLHDYEQQ